MSSRTSRKMFRALRHARKSIRIGASLAKSAQAAGELGVASGIVINRRGQMLSAAIGAPLAGANPEFLRTGAEKAIALSSIGTSTFFQFPRVATHVDESWPRSGSLGDGNDGCAVAI